MSRVLFSCVSAFGHFHPFVPLARAFQQDGQDVAFAVAPSFAGPVEAAGFPVLAAGIDQAERAARFAPYREEHLSLPTEARRSFMFTRMFGTIDAPAKVAELRAVATAWQPELIVHESADLASPIVAASLGLRSAHHAFGRLVPLAILERAAAELDGLWQEAGLAPEPLGGMFRGPYLDICPPSLQTEAPPAGARVQLVRPEFEIDTTAAPPASLQRLPDRATVYVTLGTVFNDVSIFRRLLAALADVDCNVVVTIGRDNDPASLAPLPANAAVERCVAQSLLLSRCTVVVSHGGSGSMLAALAHGLPMVLVPQGADQFHNAESCGSLGLARVLLPAELTADALREAVVALLDDPSYRERCESVAAEIAAMPPASAVVPVLVGTTR